MRPNALFAREQDLMRLTQTWATILACSAVAVFATAVAARPVHHHYHHRQRGNVRPVVTSAPDVAGRDTRYRAMTAYASAASSAGERQSSAGARARAQSHSNSAYGGASSNALVVEARKYIGTNPTGRRSDWCGAFMDMVLRRTGYAGGGNLALGYEHYGTRVSGPQVGAIAVMGRHGGGHVGVVSGVDANGNPIIVSGNHNHTVAESVYPRRRIAAYVLPGS